MLKKLSSTIKIFTKFVKELADIGVVMWFLLIIELDV